MTDGLSGIIAQLETQKAAIDKALAALREIGEVPAAEVSPAPATRKGAMTPEGKKRLIRALKMLLIRDQGDASLFC